MNRPLFVYGTLCDADLLGAVLGHLPDRRNVASAVLPGFRVVYYPGRVCPALLRAAGGVAAGHLIIGLTNLDHRLLDAYQGDLYARAIVPAIVENELHEADAHLPTQPLPRDAEPWSLAAWEANRKQQALPLEARRAAALRARLASKRPN